MPSNEYQEVVNFSQNASQVANGRVKSSHFEKFRTLKECKQTNFTLELTDNSSSEDISGNKSKWERKWMVNLSSRQLNEHETSVLNKGLNYGVSPSVISVEDVIVATEVVCDKLQQDGKEELRSKVTFILKMPSLLSVMSLLKVVRR